MTTSTAQPIRVAIIGGSGKVAREMITLLHSRGDEAVAIFRNADRSDELRELGATPVVLDIENTTVEALAEVLSGADAVVFSAGAGGGDPARTRAVDYEGAVLAIAAAEAAGVRRFVQVSAIGVGGELPENGGGTMAVYYEAKRDADVALAGSSLEWSIIRPGGLTDAPATGRVVLGEEVERAEVTRADVAAVVVALIDDPRTIGTAWELVNGDSPVAAAIETALKA
jgi:uncharacterized protein YbjT (DUF2867 family)